MGVGAFVGNDRERTQEADQQQREEGAGHWAAGTWILDRASMPVAGAKKNAPGRMAWGVCSDRREMAHVPAR
ncbi:hypothetical protein FEA48_11180 [Pseudomonas nitroreducens]|uniref:Uncharacterized protein n=1 Tax=Pseudomonas nitroreducens TaxID=46680 RepID=A0A5R9A7Z7_PSENT|nr:hypothetical protein FEA48_11180 [Pseudomonas nitroreducens]